LNDWCDSGGPERVHLPPNSLQPLNLQLKEYRYATAHVYHDIAKIAYFWGLIEATQTRDQVNPLLDVLTAHLAKMQDRCEILLLQATQCRILANQIGGAGELIRASIATLDARVSDLKVRMQTPETIQRLIDANPEFYNKFLAVLVVKNAIDLPPLLIALKSSASELAEAHSALQNVVDLNSVLTDYQNTLSRAESELGKAVHDAERAQLSESEHLGQWYARRVGNEIGTLVAWIDALPSLN
jgi:hypothetical protein